MSNTYKLSEISNLLNGTLRGDPAVTIQGVSSLCRATSFDAALFDNRKLLELLHTTKAGVIILSPEYLHHYSGNVIVVDNPGESIFKLIKIMPDSQTNRETGIHDTAVIAPTAKIGCSVSIGAHTMIGDGVLIADGVEIGSQCVVESNVHIGSQTSISSGVVISSGTRIGKNNSINHGVVIGSLPFNAVKNKGIWENGTILGGVWLSDGVVIGANSTISRGSIKDTYIGENVRIDNLVHIAHDVTIGAHTAIAGCAAIGAYAQIGEHCIIGGASCVAANVHLVEEVIITGMSTVNKSLNKPGIYSSGTLVSEHQLWRKNVARFRRLDNYMSRFAKLETAWRNDQD